MWMGETGYVSPEIVVSVLGKRKKGRDEFLEAIDGQKADTISLEDILFN